MAWGLVFLMIGCMVDIPDLESGAYPCDTSNPCAEGFYCSEAGKCIADGAPDPSDGSDASDATDATDATDSSNHPV